MKNYIRQFGLKPGDKIAVSQNDKGRPDYKAVYLGIDQYKRHFVGETDDNDKVTLVEVQDYFSRDNRLTAIDKHENDWESRQQVVNDTLSKAGQFHKLLDLNVSHFQKEYQKEQTKRISMAIGASIGTLAAGAALLFLKLKRDKKSAYYLDWK